MQLPLKTSEDTWLNWYVLIMYILETETDILVIDKWLDPTEYCEM